MGWVLLLLHSVRCLPRVGLNGKVTFAKGSRSGPRTGMLVAMEMNMNSPVHHHRLSRTWERKDQGRVLTTLVIDAFMS